MKFNGEILDDFNVTGFLTNILGRSEHKKRIKSLAHAALGLISSGSLIVHRIGRGMAEIYSLSDKHAIKQVDRLLSNEKLSISKISHYWVPYVIGARPDIMVTMDWTEFDGDNHSTLCLNLVTSHGRATPLLWSTVSKSKLKNNRNRYEDELLSQLRSVIPLTIKVTILADRGFCDIKLFEFLNKTLHFDYIIRIRGNINVTNAKGEKRTAQHWVGKSGKTKTLKASSITNKDYAVPMVACKHAKGMKQAWCIVSSREDLSGSYVIQWYAKRWGCETQFKDTKDLHFGMGLSSTHIRSTKRRDRILLIHAIATVILTILGAAGEKNGLDRLLKCNTIRTRTMSLFKQGCIYFRKLFRMQEDVARKLIETFCEMLTENKNFSKILGII